MSSCSHPQSPAFLTHHIALDRVQDTCASDRHKETVTVRVPMKLRRFGARKVIVRADQIDVDVGNAKARETRHHPLLTALIRAWRWKTMIERGEPATIRELADLEKVNASYISTLLRLTMLAPEIIEAILSGTQREDLQLEHFRGTMPLEWHEQLKRFT